MVACQDGLLETLGATCSLCREFKTPDNFYKSNNRINGRSTYCKPCHKKKIAEWRAKRPKEAQQRVQLKSHVSRNYGISIEEYEKMERDQDFKCACCGEVERTKNRRLSVDHCHKTGKVRALLCSHCNTGIGMFEESSNKLKRAIKYLEQYPETS